MGREMSKESDEKKCIINNEVQHDPCSEACNPDIETSIIITENTQKENVDKLSEEGYWFFQPYEWEGKRKFIRISPSHTKSCIDKELFWKGREKIKIIAQKPKCWEIEPEMETWYHATEPDRVEEILQDGLQSSEASEFACDCESGVYVASTEFDAFNWGLQLVKEGEIKGVPTVLAIRIPPHVRVVDDPNPIVKTDYPSSFIICSKYGIPHEFITKSYPLTELDKEEAKELYDEILKKWEEEEEY